MDLRALQSGALQQPAGGDGAPAAVGSWQALLQAGSAIAAEARAALKVCCGCGSWDIVVFFKLEGDRMCVGQ